MYERLESKPGVQLRDVIAGGGALSAEIMSRLSVFGCKKFQIAMLHDLLAAGMSLLLALYLRLGTQPFVNHRASLWVSLFLFMLIAGLTFHAFGMYRGVWRYASVPDLLAIVKAASLAILIFMPAMFLVNRLEEMPRSVPAIQWLVLVMLLGGSRFTYRLIRNGHWAHRAAQPVRRIPVLLVGAGEDAALFIRAMTSNPNAAYRVVGILDQGSEYLGRAIHRIPVVGRVDDLVAVIQRLRARGENPQRLIIAGQRGVRDGAMIELLDQANVLGLTVARLPSLVEFKEAVSEGANARGIELRPIALEDLLERPQTPLNRAALERLIAGRTVLVTGAGGTIGSELARQIAALEPGELILADSSEFNLYKIDLEIRERHPDLPSRPVLCDIRDRERVMQIFAACRPELVFHAAALKHVPMVEMNPSEGILTNVMGTRNVADAAVRYGAVAMAQVSTDKAINPCSVMGASKRLAEFYCQSLDLSGRSDAQGSPRFMTVRFGNVLGSSGSVVPFFQRQLSRGGPLTVTHPEITRYFMTVREAVELVLQASAEGIAHPERRGQIFVLDMGKPVKIVDIARQMIRLAGLEPDVDVGIEFTGLRPGEKMYEELFDATEDRLPAPLDGVLIAASRALDLELLRSLLEVIIDAGRRDDREAVHRLLQRIVPGYHQPSAMVSEPAIEPRTAHMAKACAS